MMFHDFDIRNGKSVKSKAFKNPAKADYFFAKPGYFSILRVFETNLVLKALLYFYHRFRIIAKAKICRRCPS